MNELLNNEILTTFSNYAFFVGFIAGAFSIIAIETIFNYVFDKIVYQIKKHKSKKEVDRYENS